MYVTSAIKKLKPGKNDGYDGLSSDYYCNGTPLLSRYISALFNCMITQQLFPFRKDQTALVDLTTDTHGFQHTSTVKKTIEVLQFTFENI